MFRVGLLVSAYVLIGHWAACIFFYLSKWQARAASLRSMQRVLTLCSLTALALSQRLG